MAVREAELDERDTEGLVGDLVELGMTRNEARLYLAALDQPAMRAAELAELAGVTRTKAYDALRQLVAKGLFGQEHGRVARFKAADPTELLRRLRQEGIREQVELVEDTSKLVADLFARYYAAPWSSDPFDFVQTIRNGEAAWARCVAIVAGAQAEVHYTRRVDMHGGARVREMGYRPGVRYRSLYERGFLDDPVASAQLAERQRLGEEIRIVERVRVGCCVVDRRAGVVSLTDVRGPGDAGAWVVLEHPGLAFLLIEAFNLLWSSAVPLDGDRPEPR